MQVLHIYIDYMQVLHTHTHTHTYIYASLAHIYICKSLAPTVVDVQVLLLKRCSIHLRTCSSPLLPHPYAKPPPFNRSKPTGAQALQDFNISNCRCPRLAYSLRHLQLEMFRSCY
ncbi:Hypothetical predicted protein [Podarcis lilfordi]|uniref:Uncharacterized protein n=1 Tax=Podarcis lilfordi TaxID=74358 RepID=A0AA35PKU7_9SAUR|nr:Hypothetical predicted protein [Podarcis lilfordi]